MATAWTALVSLAWLVAIFVPLERAFPARRGQRIFRKGFWTDLAFFAGQRLAFGALATSLIALAVHPLGEIDVVQSVWRRFGCVPLGVQVIAIWILGDLCAYFGHRLQHRVDFLWRFHAVHHTSEEVDWLAAHREHPIDGLYTQAIINLPAFLLGMDFRAALGFVAFRGLWAIFIHSNVRLPLGPLGYLIGSPQFHRWHHARGREVGNYANLSPWIDVVFRTHHHPGDEPESLGIDEPMPKSYLGLLLAPLAPRMGRSKDLQPAASSIARGSVVAPPRP